MARQLQARDILLSVDRSRRVLIGRQIEDQLREAIRSGALAAGSQLPSTRALSEDLHVSRGVVVRAYAQLGAEGYIELRQGANPSVSGTPVRAAAEPADRPRFDLRPHVPDVTAFPRTTWLNSQKRAFLTAPHAELGYIDGRGLERLRVEIAAYLGRSRGVLAGPDDVLITAGSTHSLALITRALARRGASAIGFENPSHRILHAVVSHCGLEPVGFAVDGDGIRPEALESATLGALVVSPAHQFPTGAVLSAQRRPDLVRWAVENDVVIVEDEYDAEFRYDKPPSRALHSLAPEHVVYLGSTSKTLAPGVRLGWAVLPKRLAASVTEELSLSLLHLSAIDQLAFADFLGRGEFDRHLRRMRALYKRRRDVLVEALHEHLPFTSVGGIAAGLHVVVDLETPELEECVRVAARARGIAVQSLSEHALPGYGGPWGLLIGYGAIADPSIPAAVAELARAVEDAQRPACAAAA
jgi:GntR family transcriptional regulator/MocR family aminotransferase